MATTAKKRSKTREISEKEFLAWLDAAKGEMTVGDFATSLGFKRQRVSAVLNGREAPGDRFLAALKKHGLEATRVVYVVKA